MYISTFRILDVRNDFKNTNVLINERVCVIPPTYYIDCLKKTIILFLSMNMKGPFSTIYEWDTR